MLVKAEIQTAGFKIIEEYFNSILLELSESLLLYPYNNKTGKDMSDLIRGQILGVSQVFKIYTAIEKFENNKVEFDKITENLKRGANS